MSRNAKSKVTWRSAPDSDNYWKLRCKCLVKVLSKTLCWHVVKLPMSKKSLKIKSKGFRSHLLRKTTSCRSFGPI